MPSPAISKMSRHQSLGDHHEHVFEGRLFFGGGKQSDVGCHEALQQTLDFGVLAGQLDAVSSENAFRQPELGAYCGRKVARKQWNCSPFSPGKAVFAIGPGGAEALGWHALKAEYILSV